MPFLGAAPTQGPAGTNGATGQTGAAGTGSASITEAQLNGAVTAGATTLTLDRNATAAFGVYRPIVIEPYSTNAELRILTAASGTTLTLNAGLSNNHADKSLVFAILGGPALIPWSWFGGLPSGASADASNNVTAFNNLAQQIYGLRALSANGWGIGIDPGLWCINNQLQPERECTVASLSPTPVRILAVSGFPFDNTGAVAMIHPLRDGSPVLYHTAGPSGRWYFRGVYVDGGGLTNACGIITSPQQPDHTENCRVDNCPGLYGFSVNDCQVHDVDNLEINNCTVPLDLNNCRFVNVSSLNITDTNAAIPSNPLVQVTDSFSVHFDTGDLETLPSGGNVFSCSGSSSSLTFTNIFTSGFTGGAPNSGNFFHFDCPTANPGGKCDYVIVNALCNQNASTVNMVNDVQRGITLDTNADTDRRMVMAYTHDSLYWFTLAGGKIKTNATYIT